MSQPTSGQPQPNPNRPPYVLTLREMNLTVQQLVSQGYTEIELPNKQVVDLTAQPLFFNGSGSFKLFPHYFLINLTRLLANKGGGNFIYVIVATGRGAYQLRVGRQTSLAGHESLAGGWPVYAAGQVVFLLGEITTLDNSSGHYMPSGVSSAFVEGAFHTRGCNATGKYTEI
jgi:hypothetical protein